MSTDPGTPAKPGVHARGCKRTGERPARFVPRHTYCPECRRHVRAEDVETE